MPNKKQLIRNAVIFQLKLGLDAVRDIILSPIAFIAVLIDLTTGKSIDDGYFYRLMNWGRLSDHWIGLFEINVKNKDSSATQQNVDQLIAQIELSFKHKNLTTDSKSKLRQYLDTLLKKTDTEASSSGKNNKDS